MHTLFGTDQRPASPVGSRIHRVASQGWAFSETWTSDPRCTCRPDARCRREDGSAPEDRMAQRARPAAARWTKPRVHLPSPLFTAIPLRCGWTPRAARARVRRAPPRTATRLATLRTYLIRTGSAPRCRLEMERRAAPGAHARKTLKCKNYKGINSNNAGRRRFELRRRRTSTVYT